MMYGRRIFCWVMVLILLLVGQFIAALLTILSKKTIRKSAAAYCSRKWLPP